MFMLPAPGADVRPKITSARLPSPQPAFFVTVPCVCKRFCSNLKCQQLVWIRTRDAVWHDAVFERVEIRELCNESTALTVDLFERSGILVVELIRVPFLCGSISGGIEAVHYVGPELREIGCAWKQAVRHSDNCDLIYGTGGLRSSFAGSFLPVSFGRTQRAGVAASQSV